MSNGSNGDNYLDLDPLVDIREVDKTPLDVDDDFYDVFKEVLPIAAKWKAVGKALRLKAGELDSIATSHPRNPEACLAEILTQWLRKNYNVKRFGEPTWQRLVEVVADPPGGANPALANQIAKNHRLSGKMKYAAVFQRRHSFSHRRPPRPIDEDNPYAQPYMEPDDLVQDVMKPSKSQMRSSWYHGKVSRQDAQQKLENASDGCFLIRESTTQPDSFALSLKHQGVVIHRMIQFKDVSYTYEIQGSRKRFTKLTDLVKYYTANYISTQGEILITPCPKNMQFHLHQSMKWDNEDTPLTPPPVPARTYDRTSVGSISFTLDNEYENTTPPPVPPRHTLLESSSSPPESANITPLLATDRNSDAHTYILTPHTLTSSTHLSTQASSTSPPLKEQPTSTCAVSPRQSIPEPSPPHSSLLNTAALDQLPSMTLEEVLIGLDVDSDETKQQVQQSPVQLTSPTQDGSPPSNPLPLPKQTAIQSPPPAQPTSLTHDSSPSSPLPLPKQMAIQSPTPAQPTSLTHDSSPSSTPLPLPKQMAIQSPPPAQPTSPTQDSSPSSTPLPLPKQTAIQSPPPAQPTSPTQESSPSSTPLPLPKQMVTQSPPPAQPTSPTQDSSPSSTPLPLPKQMVTQSSPPIVQNGSVMTHTQGGPLLLSLLNLEQVDSTKPVPSQEAKPTSVNQAGSLPTQNKPSSSRPISPLTPTEQSQNSTAMSLQPLQRKRTFQCSPQLQKITTVKETGTAGHDACTVSEDGMHTAVVGSATSFRLHIPASLAATNCTVSSEITHVLDRSIITCTITQSGEREYEISYKPELRGRHQLSVKIGAREIKGSPFAVFVHYPVHMLGKSVRAIPRPSLPQLSRPLGLTFGKIQSQIMVCESSKNTISVLNREGHKIQEIRLKGPPHGVAVDKDEYMYVTIPKLHQIQKLSKDGALVLAMGGLMTSVLKNPKGIRLSPTDGRLYVCDSGSSKVHILDTQLNLVSSFGQKGRDPGNLVSPADIAFDSTGYIYVTDSDRNRIVQFSPHNHRYVKEFGKEKRSGLKLKLNCPQGICIGLNSDVVYVTDCDHCVSIFQTSGKLLSTFGGRGQATGQFQCPTGVAVDEDGFVHVCDSDNNRIQIF